MVVGKWIKLVMCEYLYVDVDVDVIRIRAGGEGGGESRARAGVGAAGSVMRFDQVDKKDKSLEIGELDLVGSSTFTSDSIFLRLFSFSFLVFVGSVSALSLLFRFMCGPAHLLLFITFPNFKLFLLFLRSKIKSFYLFSSQTLLFDLKT